MDVVKDIYRNNPDIYGNPEPEKWIL